MGSPFFVQLLLATVLTVFTIIPASGAPLLLLTSELPPYAYTKNDQAAGFNVDIIQAVFDRMGVEIEIQIVPWQRALHSIKHGNADALFPLFKTPERKQYTDFSIPFTHEIKALFVRKDSPIIWNDDLNRLSQHKLGRVRGHSSGPLLDALIKRNIIMVDEATDSRQNISKLQKGRIDIIIETTQTIWFELAKTKQTKSVKMLTEIATIPGYLGFSKKRDHQKTIHQFNSTLQAMMVDGSYQKILEQTPDLSTQ